MEIIMIIMIAFLYGNDHMMIPYGIYGNALLK